MPLEALAATEARAGLGVIAPCRVLSHDFFRGTLAGTSFTVTAAIIIHVTGTVAADFKFRVRSRVIIIIIRLGVITNRAGRRRRPRSPRQQRDLDGPARAPPGRSGTVRMPLP
jgi:hypothetical protein